MAVLLQPEPPACRTLTRAEVGLSLQVEGYHGSRKRICTPLSGSFVVIHSAFPGLSLFALRLHAEGVRLHFSLACRTLTRAEVGLRLLAEVAREQDEDLRIFWIFFFCRSMICTAA